MKFGEKLTSLRKKENMTQEQLADYLGVSRQAVYKWENDLGYPETENLIKIGKLYSCSMDYLLNEDCCDLDCSNKKLDSMIPKIKEYKSKKMVMGMPLVHVAKNAKGFIAVGLKAEGVISVGLLSKGFLSVGVLSLGLLSIGTFSLGLLSIGLFSLGLLLSLGTIAIGLISIGVISIGLFSLGTVAIGEFSVGALAKAKYAAIGAKAYGDIAITSDTGKAYGNVASYVGDLTEADKSSINSYLDNNVPKALALFKNIFKLFIK